MGGTIQVEDYCIVCPCTAIIPFRRRLPNNINVSSVFPAMPRKQSFHLLVRSLSNISLRTSSISANGCMGLLDIIDFLTFSYHEHVGGDLRVGVTNITKRYANTAKR